MADLPVDEGYQAISDNPDAPAPAMGNDEQLLKPEGRPGDSTAWLVAIAAGATLTLTTWVIVLINHPIALAWFALHPTLNTLAIFIFLISVLQLQPTSQPRTKAVGLERHQLGMIIGVPLLAVGTLAMIYTKYSHDAPHFTSWHGTFGIICAVWLVAQFLLGGASVWFGGAAFGGGLKAKRVWKYHRLSGYILFPLVLFTAHLGGGWSTWVNDRSIMPLRLIAYTVAPIAILVAIYVRVRPSKMSFF